MSSDTSPRKTRSRFAGRGARPRSTVGQLRRRDPMVRPSFTLIVRMMVRNGKLGALILVLFGLWAIWYVFRSERFVVHSVEISGNRSLSSAEIRELAAVDEQSIWRIDPAAVAARVASSTYVVTAPVTVLLPDRVLIRVQEREAAILWSSQGTNYEVTADGRVLGTARITNTAALTSALVVYDTRQTPLSAGDQIDSDALELVQTLQLRIPAELGWTPSRYEWDPYYGIMIYNGERKIALGRMADERMPLDTKLAVVDSLDNDTSWIFLDVRSTKPYYRGAVTPTPTPEP